MIPKGLIDELAHIETMLSDFESMGGLIVADEQDVIFRLRYALEKMEAESARIRALLGMTGGTHGSVGTSAN